MSDLHFQHPERIHLLWAVLAWLAVWWALHRRGRDLLPRFVGEALHGLLVHRLPESRWLLRWACFGLAGVALVVALMRPQWGLRFVQMPRVGAEMMICLDVSKSMLAEDAAPSRLERAKADVSDLLGYLDGDHVGLIAFAGKATVLCPLTPDFGFFRLVLEGAGPQSLARGGTNLEAALRKALAGFRTEADVSRVIVLITDGEDHDHFPLEAAAMAAERGVRVLSIGFGSETGSEIYVRDDDTGARTRVRDNEGNPVVSRLDGALLREIALKTEGAYIPAGTGSLDLRSIYGAHIAPLARGRLDGRGRPVRHEGFQWAVLVALLGVAFGALAGSGRPHLLRRFREAGLAALLIALAPTFAYADEKEEPLPPAPEEEAPPPPAPMPEDARVAFNAGLDALDEASLDRAEELFLGARTKAGTDGAVRFRAGFNLGWVEIRRADALLEKEPKEALEHLERAANWFRDAVRLRPERTDARTNLEIVLRRIRELRDAIAKHDERDVVKELDELIEAQRAFVTELADASDALHSTQRDDPSARRAFRRLATTQRQRLSDASGLVERIASEQQALDAKPEKERKAEERIRAAQLAAARTYLQAAQQRMGQARSQLRRRTVVRAFRRAAAGLSDLKRARDQFRNPIEILDAVLPDSIAVLMKSQRLVSATTPPPEWLNFEHVEDERGSVRDRTEELRARLAAGLAAPPPEAEEGQDPAAAAQAKKMRKTLELAVPHLKEAVTQFDRAQPDLSARKLTDTVRASLTEATRSLARARELFLDLKRLIEAAHRVESGIVQGLDAPDVPLADLAREQTENSARAARMEVLLEEMRAEAEHKATADPKQPEDPEAAKQRTQYFAEAARLLEAAKQTLEAADSSLTIAAGENADEGARDVAKTSATQARDALDALRRHFFTLVERLRERLREQLDINDETTTTLAGDDDEARAAAIGALDARQVGNRTASDAIGQALKAQAEQAKAAPPQGPQPDGPTPAERFAKAAEHVDHAVAAMDETHTGLGATPLEPDPVRDAQTRAAEELAKALAILQPPQQQPQDQKQQQQRQDQQQQKQDKQKKDKEKDGGALQAVRDREAKRRAKRDKQGKAAEGGVEKDW